MKHPIAKVVFPITLSAFLLTGCQSPSTSVSSSSLSQPSTVIPPATVAPLPEEPASSTPTVEPHKVQYLRRGHQVRWIRGFRLPK